MRPQRKKVTWTDPAAKMGIRAVNLPHPLFPEAVLADSQLELRMPYLYIGALWQLNLDATPAWADPSHAQHELPYMCAEPYNWKWPQGTSAVYTGQVRVEEGRMGDTVRVPRHTFLIGGCRYMTTNLGLFVPVV